MRGSSPNKHGSPGHHASQGGLILSYKAGLIRELVLKQQANMAPKVKPSRAAGPELARGIGREGRSKTYKRRGLWAIKKKNGGKFPVHEKKEKPAEPEGKVLLYWDHVASSLLADTLF